MEGKVVTQEEMFKGSAWALGEVHSFKSLPSIRTHLTNGLNYRECIISLLKSLPTVMGLLVPPTQRRSHRRKISPCRILPFALQRILPHVARQISSYHFPVGSQVRATNSQDGTLTSVVPLQEPGFRIVSHTRQLVRLASQFVLWPQTSYTSVKGSGRGGQQQQQHKPALGEEGDFAVHASVYGKVQAEPNVNPNDQERRKGRERCLLLAPLSCLATYVGYVLVCPSVCTRGWYPPHHTSLSEGLWGMTTISRPKKLGREKYCSHKA
jgi:hypothetical protein